MKVCVSQSVELANGQWVKSEITIEEIDLGRILAEVDLDPKMHIPSMLVFQLLEAEAQTMLLAQMMIRFELAMRSQENLAELNKYKAAKASTLEKIKALVA